MLLIPTHTYASGEMTTNNKLVLLFFFIAALASFLITIFGVIKHKNLFNNYKGISVIVVCALIVSYAALNVMGFSTTLYMHSIVAMLCLAQIALYIKISNT